MYISKLYLLTIVFLSIFSNCQIDENKVTEENSGISFYVGTYTDAKSEGIYNYRLREDGKLEQIGLVAKTKNPSFLARSADKKYVLAVNEVSDVDGMGTLTSYLIEKDSLVFINKSSSGGADPCFVAVNKSGFVLTANYTGGNVGLLRLNEKGELIGLDVQEHRGSGTTERQEGPHAHSAYFSPVKNEVISVDLGTNELWFSHIDTDLQKLLPSDRNKLAMEEGAGPRHLAFHPNDEWFYVLNELDATVTFVQKNKNGGYDKGSSISTLPSDFQAPNYCADIHISSDGQFLYASNRGHNSIAIFAINPDGNLKGIGHQSIQGDWPRNFSFSPDEDYLVVANKRSNNIVSFKRNKSTGLLTFVHEIEAPSPVCILF